MSRLIDADALIERIVKLTCVPCREKGNDYKGVYCRACQYGDEIDDIESAPTIEPQRQSGRKVYQAGYAEGYKAGQEERKTGKWIKKDCDLLYCSECDLPSLQPWPYCERCGAKMLQEGEEDED